MDLAFLTSNQLRLLEFVKEQHGEQKRKYTNEPYWHHVVEVATLVSQYEKDAFCYVVEIALCHDLIEDTKCTYALLQQKLMDICYDVTSTTIICEGVKDLTDRYTPETTPQGNRKYRKYKEASRLGRTSSYIQSVKYADLIDNTKSIVQHDPGFAKIYIEEKKELLNKMRNGKFDLFIKCCHSLEEAQIKLNKL